MDAPEGGPEPGTRAVDRALRILMAFGRHGPALGISALARDVDLKPSTVHRIVRALVFRGFLEQDEASELYRLGHSLAVLGQAALDDQGLTAARMILERLGIETGESLNLGVRSGPSVLVIARVSSVHALRFDHAPGQRVSLHATAMGKALLAFSRDPAGEVRSLTQDEPLRAFTSSTFVDPQALLADLELIRERGYSLDEEESIAGVRCVGTPVLDRAGLARAAIAIQAPAVRFPQEATDDLARIVMAAATEVAEAMGFQTAQS